MAEITSENRLEYENYKEQFKRLNKALANGFNLEAMFIEYAILEDRTESILKHSGLWDAYLKKQKDRGPTINSKITYIRKRIESGDKILKKYFSDMSDKLGRPLCFFTQTFGCPIVLVTEISCKPLFIRG